MCIVRNASLTPYISISEQKGEVNTVLTSTHTLYLLITKNKIILNCNMNFLNPNKNTSNELVIFNINEPFVRLCGLIWFSLTGYRHKLEYWNFHEASVFCILSRQRVRADLSLYLIEMPFNNFANRADPDQAALVRAASSGSTLIANGDMIRYYPTLVDLTSNFFVQFTNMKVYLYNYL